MHEPTERLSNHCTRFISAVNALFLSVFICVYLRFTISVRREQLPFFYGTSIAQLSFCFANEIVACPT